MQLPKKTSAFLFKALLLCANYFFPNKPHMQTFLTLQSKWPPEEELCLNIIIQLSEVEIQQSSEVFESS